MVASPGGIEALDNSTITHGDDAAELPPRRATGHPDFLDLPWGEPLEEWQTERLVNLIRGISRHVVRFVEYDGSSTR